MGTGGGPTTDHNGMDAAPSPLSDVAQLINDTRDAMFEAAIQMIEDMAKLGATAQECADALKRVRENLKDGNHLRPRK